jgi:hypothetical protein
MTIHERFFLTSDWGYNSVGYDEEAIAYSGEIRNNGHNKQAKPSSAQFKPAIGSSSSSNWRQSHYRPLAVTGTTSLQRRRVTL